MEYTLLIVNPYAFSYSDEIRKMVTNDGLTITAAIGQHRMTKEAAGKFFAVHRERPFFEELICYMSSGYISMLIVEGEDAVNRLRHLAGARNPLDAAIGTMRQIYSGSIEKDAVYCSDAPETAKGDIIFFFSTIALLAEDMFLSPQLRAKP